jgi:hypothetical protein
VHLLLVFTFFLFPWQWDKAGCWPAETVLLCLIVTPVLYAIFFKIHASTDRAEQLR